MLVTMSNKEHHRLPVIQAVVEKRLRRRDAASQLDLTERQVQRLMNRFRESGAAGLTNTRRGMPGTHRIDVALRHRILTLLRENYVGFGPTLAAEKLQERHGISVSVETLRCWMTADALWVPHAHRRPRVYQPRYRRACTGELVQIDGCDHHWFEDRGPACTLLVYVDDATSRLMMLSFVHSESTFTYFNATRAYLERHGRPLAFYSDKASVFRINNPHAHGGSGQTQFGRALESLNITGICANSSQAKGRVERAHLTLQDRLVKELRLRNISTPEDANAFADEYMADYNRRFAKPPRHDFDVHRPLELEDDLDAIFTWREPRRISKSLTLQYDKVLYLLEDNELSRRFQGKYAEVWQYPNGTIELRANGTSLPFTTYDRLGDIDQGAIVDNKRLGRTLQMIKLVQEQRDNTRSQALPRQDGEASRRKKSPGKKSQRSLNQDDILEALTQLQTQSASIFGKPD
ncbi:ISNCY family transposase [Rahnella bonaserana]|jgi:transposase